MEAFLIHHGVIAVFLLAMLENDITFLLLGVVVHVGYIDFTAGVLAGVAGAVIHDSVWFAIGHHRSTWIKNSGAYRKVGPFIERVAARFGSLELALCRLCPGTRNSSVLFWGVQRMHFARFLTIEAIALTLWGTFLTVLGYALSDRATAIAGRIKSVEHWMAGALVVAVAIYFAIRAFARRKIAMIAASAANRERPAKAEAQTRESDL